MPLNSTTELKGQDLTPYIEFVNSLSQMYFDYVANSQDDTYSYTVDHFGGKERAPGIHASEISNCMKLMVYSLMNTQRYSDPSTSDVNMLMRFALGTAVHAMVQNDWHRICEKTAGQIVFDGCSGYTLSFQDEVKISPELGGLSAYWNLHSACDGIFTLWSPHGQPVLRIGLEIKTESDKQFDKLTQPRVYHKKQTTLYMAALDIPLLWVFYYNKSNSNISTSYPPYVFQFDEKLWKELENRFSEAHQYAASQQLPQGTEGMHCRWCAYSYTCKPAILSGRPPKRDALTVGMRRRTR